MSHYGCDWGEWEGERICRLRDAGAQTEIDLLPDFGMNVIRFASRGRDVVLQPPSLEALRATPFRYGIPVLSPPGRTSRGLFRHRGVNYKLPTGSDTHNMHGEIGKVAWRILQYGVDAVRGAYLEAEYAYRDDPLRFASYPADLRISVRYRLKDGALCLEGAARNEGSKHAPFSLGYHPYFVCDLRRTSLRIPVSGQWPMDRDGSICALPKPTDLAVSVRKGLDLLQVAENLHFFQCRSMSGRKQSSTYVCRLEDRNAERRIYYRVGNFFSTLALFLPEWGEAVSLEPHSCLPDAFNLPLKSPETGVQELAPGEERQFEWRITVENDVSARRSIRCKTPTVGTCARE